MPVPQIVLAEDKNQRGKYLVVDGKQRLITLFAFFSEDTSDRFKLTGLKSSKINGLDFTQLEQQHPDLYNNLLNQSIRSIIIKNWTTENLLYTIFFRLNSGSLPLSPQELRKALKPGEFLKKVDYYCLESTAIKFLFGDEVPDPRMRDMDLLLRFFVMTRFIEEYRGNYKNAVDQVCDFYNKSWNKSEAEVTSYLEKFEHTIAKARMVFGDDEVFRRKSNSKVERRINRAIFDIIIYYLSQIDEKEVAAFSVKIKTLTEALTQSNPQFMKAISSNTNNLKETSTRFVIYGEGLQGLSINVRIPQNLKDYYSKL